MAREYTPVERRQNNIIGLRIEKVRKLRGVSQKQLAKAIGLKGFKQMYRYESGASMITAPRLISIANALNIPPSYFLESLPTNAITEQPQNLRAD